MTSRRREVPGTGLPVTHWLVILSASVALFLLWGGPLWRSTPASTHVMRFVVSYLAVVPLATAALLLLHRLTLTRLAATTGSEWGVKLLITAALYLGLAHGTAAPLVPKPAEVAAPAPTPDDYRAALPGFASASIRGQVIAAGHPVAGALVYLDQPSPGAPEPPTDATLVVDHAFRPAVVIASPDANLHVSSPDDELHLIRILEDGRVVETRPLPPGSRAIDFQAPDPGLYQLRCGRHPDETGWLLVADHPYATITDASGHFALASVPLGPARVVVVSGAATVTTAARVLPGGVTLTLDLDLANKEAAR